MKDKCEPYVIDHKDGLYTVFSGCPTEKNSRAVSVTMNEAGMKLFEEALKKELKLPHSSSDGATPS